MQEDEKASRSLSVPVRPKITVSRQAGLGAQLQPERPSAQGRAGRWRGGRLVVDLDHGGGDVDCRIRVENRGLRRGNIEDHCKAVLPGILINHAHHLAADFVDGVLLGLLKLRRGILVVAVELFGPVVNAAQQPGSGLVAQRGLLILQLGLQFPDFGLLLL